MNTDALYEKLARQALKKEAVLGSLIGGIGGGLLGKSVLKKLPRLGATVGGMGGSLAGPALFDTKMPGAGAGPPPPHVVGR